MQLINSDCLTALKALPDDSVDLVLTDPPYQLLDCKWDKGLQWDKIWPELNRITKKNGNIALFCSFPFTIDLINTNRSNFRYCWTWIKNNYSGFSIARYQPMRRSEHIAVFFNALHDSNTGKYEALRRYFFDELNRSGLKRKDIDELLGSHMSSHYFTNGAQFAIPSADAYAKLQTTGYFQRPYDEIKAEWQAEGGILSPAYYPQGVRECAPRKSSNIGKAFQNFKRSYYYKNRTGYPSDILEFKSVLTNGRLHTSEKPTDLLAYLIKTYTQEGQTVLDFCAGSFSTGEAALSNGRDFIGIEIEPKYFEIGKERLKRFTEQAA